MKFSWFRLLPVITVTMGCGLFSAMSRAELLCDTNEVRNYLPEGPKGCHRERIQASGGLSFGVLNSASKLAEKAWEREVLTKYGERYKDIADAACIRPLCVNGSISGTKRCTISAFPCAHDMDPAVRAEVQQLASRSDDAPDSRLSGLDGRGDGYYRRDRPVYVVLTPDEIADVQRYLGVNADGVWGPESQRALNQLRRSSGLRFEGPPSRGDLEFLRKRRL
jgi:hypothetical protein